MRWTALLLLLALLAPAVSPATAQSKTAAPLRVVLDNGLTVIVQETHATEIVTLQAWVKVGSRDETDETNGAAHFVEHMLFKGTQRRRVGQIDREVEGLGGILNASTSFDYTQYFIVSASRFFDKILGIQSDALMRSTFDPQEFERERLVIIEELNRRDDTPSTRTFDALYTTAYTVHPYRRPIGGSRAVIQQMTRDQLLGFYTTHYPPGNVTVVVVGDVSAQDAVHKVRRAYGGWRRPAPPRQQFAPEPPFAAVRRSVIEGDVRVAYLNMGWLGPAARDRDVYAMDVLLYALGRGRGSRLVRSNQEGQRPVREQGVSDEDLRRAKTLLEGEEIVSTHTTRGLATTLGFYATVADLEFALTYRDRIRQVSREDVQRVALRFLDPQRYALVVLQPRR